MKMSFSIDSGSAFDLRKIHEIAETLKADLPPGDPRPNQIRTLARRISQEAKITIEGDGERDRYQI